MSLGSTKYRPKQIRKILLRWNEMEGWRDMVNNNVDSTNELMNLQKLHKDFNASLLKIRTLMKDNFTSDSNHDSVGIQQSLDKFKRVMEKRVLLFDHLQGENDFVNGGLIFPTFGRLKFPTIFKVIWGHLP